MFTLEASFNPEGDIHFLTSAEKQILVHEKERDVHQVRVALTFQENFALFMVRFTVINLQLNCPLA